MKSQTKQAAPMRVIEARDQLRNASDMFAQIRAVAGSIERQALRGIAPNERINPLAALTDCGDLAKTISWMAEQMVDIAELQSDDLQVYLDEVSN